MTASTNVNEGCAFQWVVALWKHWWPSYIWGKLASVAPESMVVK